MASLRCVTLFGGSGFIGRAILRQLAHHQVSRVTLVSRHTPSQPLPAQGIPHVKHVCADIRDHNAVRAIIKEDGGHVINLVGLLYESPRRGIAFNAVHSQGAKNIMEAVADVAEDKRGKVVHISAIGADRAQAKYAETKHDGEKTVQQLGKHLGVWNVILRPSIVWGEGDSFFNKFKDMARLAPALPLIGGGHTKYQPVHVDDVAKAVLGCLGYTENVEGKAEKSETAPAPTKAQAGDIYELGGPDVFTFRQLMEMTLKCSRMRRMLVPIPFGLATPIGAASELLHYIVPALPPVLTRDQVELLKSDNIVSPKAKTFDDLGIVPIPLNEENLSYLYPA